MKKLLIFICIIILFISKSNSQEYKGQMTLYKPMNISSTSTGLSNEDFSISLSYSLLFTWKLWTLLNEPVYNVRSVVVISHADVKVDGKNFYLPVEVIKKITPIDINLHGLMKSKSKFVAANKPTFQTNFVHWDAGAPSSISFVGTVESFKNLPPKEQEKYFSFNTPASCAWSKLFTKFNSAREYYLSEPEAKAFYKKELKLVSGVSNSGLQCSIDIKWNVSAVREWLEKEEKLKEDKKEKTLENDFWSTSSISEEKQNKKKEIKKSDDDFWSTSSIKSNKKENTQDDFWSSSKNTANNNAIFKVHYGKNHKYGFVNENGTTLIPHIFDELKEFSDGLAAAEKNGKWGFINKNGEWAIKPQYLEVENFKHGMAKVTVSKEKESYGYEYWTNDTFTFYHRKVIDKKENTVLRKKEYTVYSQPRGLTLTTSNIGESSTEKARRKREWEIKKKAMIKRDRAKYEKLESSAEARGYTRIK